jgi:hypothetical protein
MKPTQIKDVLSNIKLGPSKWELDTIIWHDRLSNPNTLVAFLSRIQELQATKKLAPTQKLELDHLLELLDEIEETDINYLIERSEEEEHDAFIENLAKKSALEVLTRGKIDFETLEISCKLSPNDFILCAKRTQDLLNTISGLVIKGESLSQDVAGA